MQSDEFEGAMRIGEVDLVFRRGWLERLREQRPALDKKATIDHALEFANTGSPRSYAAVMQGVGLAFDRSPDPLNGEQGALRDALTAIVESRATPLHKAAWIAVANELLPVPTYRLVGKALRTEMRYQEIKFSAPISARIALVLMWLIDPASSDSFGARLKQCHYGKCRKFSIAQPAGKQGRWRTLYCDLAATHPEDHMKKAHNERKRRAPNKPK